MAAFGAISMDVTNPKIGATQYSILMGFGNAGEMSGTAISGTIIAIAGFSRVFLFSAWIYGPALLILYLFRLKDNNHANHWYHIIQVIMLQMLQLIILSIEMETNKLINR